MTGFALQDGQADLPSPNPTSSYWHRSPSSTLLGHRTTAELPEKVDVVVIGSGITGAFAARELVEEKGRGVLLLEAREVAWGATGRVSLRGFARFIQGVFFFLPFSLTQGEAMFSGRRTQVSSKRNVC